MKIKILKSLAGLDFSFYAGQIVEIDDKNASQLIKAGLAEEVENDANNTTRGKKLSKGRK